MTRAEAFAVAPPWIQQSAEVVASAMHKATPGSDKWCRVRDAAAVELMLAYRRGRELRGDDTFTSIGEAAMGVVEKLAREAQRS